MLTILNHLPFHIDLPLLMDKLKIKGGTTYASWIEELASEAEAIARPKAIFGLSFIDGRGENWVEVDGVRFTSRILQVNLQGTHRVFPYVATCGEELNQWSAGKSDFLLQFWADAIKEMALHQAVEALKTSVDERFQPGPLASMNPGSLGDFPLSAQPGLFSLLGDVKQQIGVQLTPSLLMLPTKSVSGILFPTEQLFFSCQLCPRQNCPSRRAPYDANLYQKKYAQAS